MKKLLFLTLMLGVGVYIIQVALTPGNPNLADNLKKKDEIQKASKKAMDKLSKKDKKVLDKNTSSDSVKKSADNDQIDELEVPSKIPETDEESLAHYTKVLRFASTKNNSPDKMIEHLEALEIAPRKKVEESEEAGSVTFIRTQKSLKGTKYFHAQYVGDDDNSTLEHMSFNLRPGSDSFQNALNIIENEFKVSTKGKLKFNKPDAKGWSLDNGYIVWVKTLKKEDLNTDLFNAYSESDIGSVRVVVELDIHPAGDDHSGHDH